MYETLLTNEECAKAVRSMRFLPCAGRITESGLVQQVFQGQQSGEIHLTEFNSNNTKQLNLEETKAKIASLAYIQEELAKMEN